jgi:hypothetical protein
MTTEEASTAQGKGRSFQEYEKSIRNSKVVQPNNLEDEEKTGNQ